MSNWIELPGTSWRPPVPTAAQLPPTGNNIGDAIIAEDTQTIFVWNGTSWIPVATPGAAIAIDGLTGDVSASGPGVVTATVNSVGGATAANIAAASNANQTATSANTPNTLVKRDGFGNFSAGTITANLTGNVSGSSSSFTGSLSGDVTGTQSATSISSPTVTSKLLTGLGTGPNTTITGLDSILSAFQKLQAQISAETGSAITALTGDGTATGPGSVPFTLATVNGNVGSFGNSTNVSSFTVNAKGLITAASNTPIVFPVTSVTGSGNIASSGGSTPNITFTGILPVANGGTGSSTQNFVDLTTNQTVAGTKTFSSNFVISANGAASTPAETINGTWFSGGTSTTTKPQVLIEPTGTSSATWSTSGTGLGVNAPTTGFTGRIIDLQLAGTSLLSLTPNGTARPTLTLIGSGVNPVPTFALSAAGGSTVTWTLETAGNGNNEFVTRVGGNAAVRVTTSGLMSVGGLVVANSGSPLGVKGGLAVGSTYYTLAAPTDGAIINGNVGIGNSSPLYKLDVTGNIAADSAGSGFLVKEGPNAKQGTSVLVGGTVTVSNTSVTANSRIFLTAQNNSGTTGFLSVSARTAGTSFTILSSSVLDTSIVAWEIFEPA
jgi:hypothetical protein